MRFVVMSHLSHLEALLGRGVHADVQSYEVAALNLFLFEQFWEDKPASAGKARVNSSHHSHNKTQRTQQSECQASPPTPVTVLLEHSPSEGQ